MSDEPERHPFQILSEEFDKMCQERHLMGAEKYGPTSFLGRDTIGDILEEIADAANYLRYFYIKLRLLEGFINDPVQQEKLGVDGFISMNKKDT